MSSASPLDAKEMVRQAVDIVDLIGESYELRRQGRNYVCRCPWHDDNKPSLTVNQERQTWRCWVCDIGGDLFSFVMRRDGVEFREALETLAERAGVNLAPAHGKPAQQGGPGDKKTLYRAVAYAEAEFHRFLLESADAAAAREYLAERRINAESIRRHRIGFAPDRWDWLKNKAAAQGYSTPVLSRVGLVREREQGGGAYDFFRGRVIFPIHDVQGRPIAFGGRVLPQYADKAGGKYVNSPETPLYSKSNQLYALHLAREAVKREGQLAVMEGYTDVVMAHQHGVTNVVACCGTALGESHLRLIQRFTDRVTLVLDGDDAGQRRASEVLEMFVANQVDLRILTLPENLDPCDFIATPENGPKDGGEGVGATRGVEAFRELLSQAPDALQHKLNTVTNGLVPLENTHAATRAAEEVLATLARATSGRLANSAAMLREQSVLGALATRLRLPQDRLRARLAVLRSDLGSRPAAGRPAPHPTRRQDAGHPVADPNNAFFDSAYEDLEEGPPNAAAQSAQHGAQHDAHGGLPARLTGNDRELLELMLLDTECARRIAESIPPAGLESSTGRELFQACLDALEVEGRVDLAWLLGALPNERLKSALVALDDDAQAKSSGDKPQRLADLMARHERLAQHAVRQRHKAALSLNSLSENEELEALSDIFANLKKSRQTGTLPTEG